MRLFFTFYIILEIVQRPTQIVFQSTVKHRKCVSTPLTISIESQYSKNILQYFIYPEFCAAITKKTAVNWCRLFFSSCEPRFMCLHQLCSSKWAWVVPYYLILILPSLGGSQSLTVSRQNHKTSSLQQWVRIHACIQTKCEANLLSILTVWLSLWLNSELTHNSLFFLQ